MTKLIDVESATTGDIFKFASHQLNKTCQVYIETAADVSIYGRSESDAPWIKLGDTIQSSIAFTIDILPEMQVITTNHVSGRAAVWLN